MKKKLQLTTYKKTSAFFKNKPVSSNRLITKTKVTIIIIKNNIIIIIRTFPESFSPKKFSLPNNFINIKRSRMLRHVDVDTNHEISLMSDFGDVISHVTMAKNVFLACCGDRFLSIRKQQTWLGAHCYGSFRNGR